MLLTPQFPVPQNVRIFMTSDLSVREGEASGEKGKRLVEKELGTSVTWLHQVHSHALLELPLHSPDLPEADGVWTQQVDTPCVVRTADCLPVLFTSRDGGVVGAVHAGWRGLDKHILRHAVATLPALPEDLLVWIGAGICQQHYQVGHELFDAFAAHGDVYEDAFRVDETGAIYADLPKIARLQMEDVGVLSTHIFGGNLCTYSEEKLHSHRRDGEASGRIATGIIRLSS